MKDRGDRQFQYLVSRFFNFNAAWDETIEKKAGMLKIEQSRMRKIQQIYSCYSDYFYILVLFAALGVLTTLSNKRLTPKLIGLLLFGSFAASYSVYLLISLFAVPNFSRLLAIVSIPLLSLTAYFFALLLQSGMGVVCNRVKLIKATVCDER
ncbi:MAG: hypothetical protein DSY80_07220 [Desulfocapsa sp.]|nr:MAG: hypothetical protein DSY80_07220 [Desulfocapsa sp.]